MDTGFGRAVAQFITDSPHVLAAHDLINKWRLDLTDNHTLDLFYNSTTGKYSYTLVFQNKRVLGWDNALHHPGLTNFPHHLHLPNGTVVPSTLTGLPEPDIQTVRVGVESYLENRLASSPPPQEK